MHWLFYHMKKMLVRVDKNGCYINNIPIHTRKYNGNIVIEEANYRKRKLHGTFIRRYNDGSIQEISTFNRGLRHGKCFRWVDGICNKFVFKRNKCIKVYEWR